MRLPELEYFRDRDEEIYTAWPNFYPGRVIVYTKKVWSQKLEETPTIRWFWNTGLPITNMDNLGEGFATKEEAEKDVHRVISEWWFSQIDTGIHVDILDRYLNLLSHYDTICDPVLGTEEPHLNWMLWEIKKGNVKNDKAHRWLGFIQGMLTAKGYINVNEERDFTRPYFTGVY